MTKVKSSDSLIVPSNWGEGGGGGVRSEFPKFRVHRPPKSTASLPIYVYFIVHRYLV